MTKELEQKWKEIAYQMYKLLDDIDTADDMTNDDKTYREMVRMIHHNRFQKLDQNEVDDLYTEFYKTGEEE
jgi:hypothetical protein